MIGFLGFDFSIIGGVEITTKRLVRALCSKNIESKIYSLYQKNKNCDMQDVTFLNYTGFRPWSMARSFFTLRKNGCNTIVTSYFSYNILNILFSFFLGYRSVVQEHCSFFQDAKYKRLIKLLFYRFADNCVILNEYDATIYRNYGVKVSVIPNFFEPPYNMPNMKIDSLVLRPFMVVSRIDENKRVELAIEAFLRYKALGGISSLVIVGDGPLLDYLKYQYTHNQEISFLGMLSDPFDVMQRGCALLLTSRLECLPTTIIEAKFASLPVIAFKNPSGIAEMIEHGKTGYLVDDDNTDTFADYMLLFDDEALRKKLSYNAYNSRLRYSVESVITDYLLVLEGKR